MSVKAYACLNKNDNDRSKSSSGGIFVLMMRTVIAQNGVVFGAKFDENWQVVHDFAETLEGVEAFLGSKYVQSAMGDCFRKAKEFLEQGRMVLFSGTPCQINGLKSYLGKEYENLLTVDFICHGVPSPAVWKQYLEECSKGKRITNINFRDKTEGWRKFSLSIEFSDGTVHRKNQFFETYLKGFLKDIYLRPSCYECSFKSVERISDFTLADFWSADKVKPEMFDDKGISIVLVQSENGAKMWQEISEEIQMDEIPVDMVVQYNKNAVKSVPRPQVRDEFFKNNNGTLINKIEGYTKVPVSRRVKMFVKKVLVKLGICKR